MRMKNYSRKAISILLSVLLVATMLPMSIFVSTAATAPVVSSGEWNFRSKETPEDSYYSRFKNNYSALDLKGPEFVTMVVAGTNFFFMQTEDNQEMSYTTHFYAQKNNRLNGARINYVNTNYNNDTVYSSVVTNETWTHVSGKVDNENSNGSPDGIGLYGYALAAAQIAHYSFKVDFTANGSAVYTPEWEINFNSGAASTDGGPWTTSNFNVDGVAINENPVFTVTVVDLREIRQLITIANNINEDVSDIVGTRDFSGATYYSQSEIDTLTAQLRARLLCDYTDLDAQLARAAAIEDNINGGLSGHLYDETLYNVFSTAYSDAAAVDRFLMEDGTGDNQDTIDSAALTLQTAIDNLLPSRMYLINYYSDGVLYAQNTVDPSKGYNFHDATDKFIAEPTLARYEFDGWTDSLGNYIDDDYPVTGDMNVYAGYKVALNGIGPVSSSGRWDHIPSADNNDGRGEHYVTMWVKDTTFNFVQIADDETFSFYTDLSGFKNSGTNYAVIHELYFMDDTDTQAFTALLPQTGYLESYCTTGNAGDFPSGDPDGAFPGENHGTDDDFVYQSITNVVNWRFVYTFNADGAATYHPKWDMKYETGGVKILGMGTGTYYLSNDNEPIEFTINVTDLRELINEVNKAESVYNNSNSGFSQSQLDDLRTILDNIENNYVLDGTEYYEQSEIDALVAQIKAIIPNGMQIPCDYTELDAAIALANQKKTEYNNNADSHFINEVWTNFETAYAAATSIDRNLYIVDTNENQALIDRTTADLLKAIDSLLYQTHVNEPCDTTSANDVMDEANAINNDNGKYDDDAYQDFLDAKDALENLLDQGLYDDENGTNQQTIDDAVQALEDAIAALNDAQNQNPPCDYTALNEAIAAASSITDSDLFTPATYQALQDALTAAENVPAGLYDNGTNQGIIDDATDDLIDAINNLLSDVIANSNNVSTDGMTSASETAFTDAVAAAEQVTSNPNATAQDKADAINGIVSATDALTPDKTELGEIINLAEAIDTTIIDPAVVQVLQDAIADGQSVYDNDAATVQDINDAIQTLKDAIDDVLQSIVNDANNIDATAMTPITQANFEDALDDAQNLIDNGGSAQEKADAINALVMAIDNLTPDKTELEEAITAAQGVDTTDIPQTLAEALEDAITDGQTVNDDTDATVQEIADAVDAINNALDNILEYVKEQAENTDTTGMTPDSIQDLEDIIRIADDLLNDPDATAEEKAQAIEDIKNAVDNLTVDKSSLSDLIDQAEAIDQDDYTGDSATALQNEIDDAYVVLYDDNATASDVAQAITELQNAIDNLIDRTALAQAIADAQAVDTLGYTPDSIRDLLDAIDAGQTVYDDSAATAAEIAQAIADIEAAVNGLTYMNIITKDTHSLRLFRDTTANYMVGIDPTANTVADIKAGLVNDARTIIILKADGVTELTETEKAGTGYLIRCVNADNHNTVYDEATIILYGDVDGDADVDSDDHDILKDSAFFDGIGITADTVYFYAADLDGDKVLDGFDYYYQDVIMTTPDSFNQSVVIF